MSNQIYNFNLEEEIAPSLDSLKSREIDTSSISHSKMKVLLLTLMQEPIEKIFSQLEKKKDPKKEEEDLPFLLIQTENTPSFSLIADKEEDKVDAVGATSKKTDKKTDHPNLKQGLGGPQEGAFNKAVSQAVDAPLPTDNAGKGFNPNSSNGVNWPLPDGSQFPFDPNDICAHDTAGLLQKLKLWMHFIVGRGEDMGAIFGFVQFVMNIQSHLSTDFSPKDQEVIQKALSGLNNLFGKGKVAGPFALFIVQAFRGLSFFNSGGNEQECIDQMQAFISALDNIPGLSSNPFLNQLDQIAHQLGNPEALKNWFPTQEDDQGDPKYTKEQYWQVQMGLADDFFFNEDGSLTQSIHDYEKTLMIQMIDYLIAKYAHGGAILLAPLIMSALGTGLAEKNQTLGSYGYLLKILQDAGKDVSDITGEFSQIQGGSGTDFKNWIAKMRELEFNLIQRINKYGPNLVSQIKTAFANVFNLKLSLGGSSYSINELIDNNMIGDKLGQFTWDQVKDAFNKEAFPGLDPTKDEFNLITGGFNTAAKAVAGMSQTTQTLVSQISSKITTLQSTIKSLLIDYYAAWIRTLVNNQKSS